MKDIQKRGKDAVGDNAMDFINSLMTVEERAESDLRGGSYRRISKGRDRRKGISQKSLKS